MTGKVPKIEQGMCDWPKPWVEAVNAPIMQSLLYDLDLMPEQLEPNTMRWQQMLIIVQHFKHFMERSAAPADAVEQRGGEPVAWRVGPYGVYSSLQLAEERLRYLKCDEPPHFRKDAIIQPLYMHPAAPPPVAQPGLTAQDDLEHDAAFAKLMGAQPAVGEVVVTDEMLAAGCALASPDAIQYAPALRSALNKVYIAMRALEPMPEVVADGLVKILAHLYFSAYHAGHNDTVEANYTDVLVVDADTYWQDNDAVMEAAAALERPADGLAKRITEYLSGGGLFNPELADHDAVRDLLIDCRAALERPAGGSCDWTQDVDGNWNTQCGKMYTFIDGGPEDNSHKFCHACGKPLYAHPSPERSGGSNEQQ